MSWCWCWQPLKSLDIPLDFTETGGSFCPLGARIQVQCLEWPSNYLDSAPSSMGEDPRMVILRPVEQGVHSHLIAVFIFPSTGPPLEWDIAHEPEEWCYFSGSFSLTYPQIPYWSSQSGVRWMQMKKVAWRPLKAKPPEIIYSHRPASTFIYNWYWKKPFGIKEDKIPQGTSGKVQKCDLEEEMC